MWFAKYWCKGELTFHESDLHCRLADNHTATSGAVHAVHEQFHGVSDGGAILGFCSCVAVTSCCGSKSGLLSAHGCLDGKDTQRLSQLAWKSLSAQECDLAQPIARSEEKPKIPLVLSAIDTNPTFLLLFLGSEKHPQNLTEAYRV